MRILHTSVIILFIVSLAMVSVSQATKTNSGMYTAYLTRSDVPLPSAGPTKIDSSKVKFLPRFCKVQYPQNQTQVLDKVIVGIVAREIDLSDDSTAQQILQMGITFGQESVKCEDKLEIERDTYNGNIRKREVSVALYPGDPATVTAADLPQIMRITGITTWDQRSDEVLGYWNEDKPGLILQYFNAPKALRQTQAYDAQQERLRNAASERATQVWQKKQAENAARWAAFVKSTGVKYRVTENQLATNPFVYQGKVVAIFCTFERMSSATQAIFSFWGRSTFVVSGVSSSKFTQRGSVVLLAGRVLGNIEVNPGPTLVPHLSFVGSAFCQQSDCSEYISIR